MSTVSIIIIGDEILGHKFVDENTPYLLRRCAELNLHVQSVQIIPDCLDRIENTVRSESNRSTYVFTTGGIGPTHDDKTFEGIAQAFGEKCIRHPELVGLIQSRKENINPAAFRMADVPASTQLLKTSLFYPQLCVHNVFIFPGVPHLLQMKFEAIAHLFIGRKKHHGSVQLQTEESNIAVELTRIQNEEHGVTLGSYPRLNETPSLILTVDGWEQETVVRVTERLKSTFKEYAYS